MRVFSYIFASIVLLTGLVAISGCSSNLETARTLSNQGVLGLSDQNAYLGSNLFLAREAEKSQFLFNFLKARGGPTAIKVVEDNFQAPQIYMYYLREKELYIAELDDQRGGSSIGYRQWIVRGPFGLPRKDYREVSQLQLSGEPVFMIFGKPYRFGKQPERAEQFDLQVVVPPPPPPTPKPKPAKKQTTEVSNKVPATPTPPAIFTPLNFDQQALMMSQGFAERSRNGDVIHTVRSSSESIADIARWYTGDALKSSAILQANPTITTPESMSVGTRVTIPAPLVKQFKQMPPSPNPTLPIKAPGLGTVPPAPSELAPLATPTAAPIASPPPAAEMPVSHTSPQNH